MFPHKQWVPSDLPDQLIPTTAYLCFQSVREVSTQDSGTFLSDQQVTSLECVESDYLERFQSFGPDKF